MPIQDKLRTLLEWCTENGIIIDERISIGTDSQAGIAVYSEDDYIHPQTTLVKIPKSAILSVRSCSLEAVIPEAPYGLGAQLSLSLALYAEILRGMKSRWHGYIQSLPADLVDLPSFWDFRLEANTGSTSHHNVANSRMFLRGTEAGKICNGRLDNGYKQLEEVTQFYHEVAEPLLQRNAKGSDVPTLLGFYRAFSLVSSRAFLVDAYHGLSMVPIADAFNHTLENHVHLESDYNVCCECGSLYECIHDREEGAKAPGNVSSLDEHDLYYEMVSNTGIPPHTEVFNTYGEDLSNAQLLNQYGFILDVNENDRLLWSADDLLNTFVSGRDTASHRERLTQDLRNVSSHFEKSGAPDFGQSQLIYHEASRENIFCLNSDGIMSHHLWLALFVLSVWRTFPGGERVEPEIAQMALSVLELQTELELQDMDDVNDNDEDMGSDYDEGDKIPIRQGTDTPTALVLLIDIAQLAVNLCVTRKAASGPEGYTAEQLTDILDAEAATRTDETCATSHAELAISVLLGEWSILDSCEAAWKALRHAASRRMCV
ncbi:SET domain-containing protein [Pholiota conissans]|uniref:SET domain-containing protein n=1 Tax=Pholiota conissans TaxID=109636 RepID=A0A9P6D081_9AGAR|nr:SET domain-containing protein [Pholiota conissans]